MSDNRLARVLFMVVIFVIGLLVGLYMEHCFVSVIGTLAVGILIALEVGDGE